MKKCCTTCHRKGKHKGKTEAKARKTLFGESFLSSFTLLVKSQLVSTEVIDAVGKAKSYLGTHPARCYMLRTCTCAQHHPPPLHLWSRQSGATDIFPALPSPRSDPTLACPPLLSPASGTNSWLKISSAHADIPLWRTYLKG